MRRVLVLDDQPRALEEARATLSRHGFEVLALDNPLMLAGTLRRNTVDVVVLEPELSTMKGAVVVQALRAHGLDTVPIGLWSGADEATLSQRRAECRAEGTARKSDPAGLLRLVRALVASAGGG